MAIALQSSKDAKRFALHWEFRCGHRPLWAIRWPPDVIVIGTMFATDPFGIIGGAVANNRGGERTGLCFGTTAVRSILVVDALPRTRARTAMYQAGQIELRCASILNSYTGDRATFEATIRRGLGGPRQYQVFAMQPGLLFLDRRDQKETAEYDSKQRTALALAMFGGAIGGMLVKPKVNPAKRESGLELKTDDELLELARSRKKSFVVRHEEVLSISIDPPSGWDKLFGHRTLAGWITMDTVSQGKLVLEFREAAVMAVAAESLPRRYGTKVAVNAELDERRKQFVALRRR